MKKFLLPIFLLALFRQAHSQNITVPDAAFVSWLQANIPSAMSGNQMDTTSPAVTSLKRISVENLGITDLTGAQYFDSLMTLDCGNVQYIGLKNTLTSLPRLPNMLDTLICGLNQITALPALPNSLEVLKCYSNQLSSLPALPSTLKVLECQTNLLTSLPSLPSLLVSLDCADNSINTIPALPNLTNFGCDSNLITSLPPLPNSISILSCSNNQISSLPTLPSSLYTLNCSLNPLTSGLPALPNGIVNLDCWYAQLPSLPALPPTLVWLYCNNNQLTSLPPLPNSLQFLWCYNNNISCFPVFPNSLVNACDIHNNPFTCLPNYVSAMDAPTLTFPLCLSGNTNGCPNAQGLFGFTYEDINSNCLKNVSDTNLKNVPMRLYGSGNSLLGFTYSALNGVYDFPQTLGTYTIVIDTAYMPFRAQCAYPGLDTAITVVSLDTNINFSLDCKPGFDVGAQSVLTYGLVFPGQLHVLNAIAGDLSHWYNLNCASGISGQVQITVTGPVTYVSTIAGSLTPSVSGNTYTYSIADFGVVNNWTAFNLVFATNTTAHAGDTICVNISVTPTAGDNNISNNSMAFCYYVINSHDPNRKDVYPIDVPQGFQDWFTYTIQFQNTGTAPAIDIRVTDSLDNNLDLTTLQVINYSHSNSVSLNGRFLAFNFHNINLPDSASNPQGSIGYVQYRIKPKANLSAGTKLYNSAWIYFDYNWPIVTDTTINTFTSPNDVKNIITADQIKIFPNPTSDNFYIEANIPNKLSLDLYDVNGRRVFSTSVIDKSNINIANLDNGAYTLTIKVAGRTINKKLVIVR